ncbi:hypothetical protein NLM31_36835 [Bradyrhizobium sp. CCGUVB4N]|uniref:hypothetical protein n=1 Tax=Bradyrhizobium sp. CCGUVB4N TaxID=2949631 RepID=UPI0020B32558|nr:hypothetical protein [Bradyrhizobium sp. CCGUVB4N]MCP3385969.1 hypothetical protein [Bradyrhizobium sp. CCGUVB4N]
MNNDKLTYRDLVASYGEDGARYILRSIERMAEIGQREVPVDGQLRLQAVLDLLNDAQPQTKH